MNWLNFKLKLGARYEYFDYNSFLYTAENQKVSSKTGRLYQLLRSGPSETLTAVTTLSKGVSLQADYSIYTDNFVTYKGHTFFSALKLSFLSVLPLTSHLSLLPSIDGRAVDRERSGLSLLNVVEAICRKGTFPAVTVPRDQSDGDIR